MSTDDEPKVEVGSVAIVVTSPTEAKIIDKPAEEPATDEENE